MTPYKPNTEPNAWVRVNWNGNSYYLPACILERDGTLFRMRQWHRRDYLYGSESHRHYEYERTETNTAPRTFTLGSHDFVEELPGPPDWLGVTYQQVSERRRADELAELRAQPGFWRKLLWAVAGRPEEDKPLPEPEV